MKVLLYAVFKGRERDSRPKPNAAPSKLNSAVPAQCMHCVSGDPLSEGRATDAEKHRALSSHPRLSRVGRVNPEYESIVCGRPRMSAVALALGANQRHGLLRKEVIQPHLPIRLPCYDFVPLT